MTTSVPRPVRAADAPAWAPWSSCTLDCLEAPDATAGRLRTTARLLAVGVALAATPPVCALAWLGALAGRPGVTNWLVRAWCRATMTALGVRLTLRGEAHTPPGTLYALNHVSWLDVLALEAVRPATMVARADVRGWPVVGHLARWAGTIWIDRAALSALPATVAEVAATLRDGTDVAAYPEGVTWCGTESGRFHPALFQAAVDVSAPVVPVAVRYRVAGRPSTAASYVGTLTFWASIRRVAATRALTVELDVRPPLPAGLDRRALARLAQAAVTDVPA